MSEAASRSAAFDIPNSATTPLAAWLRARLPLLAAGVVAAVALSIAAPYPAGVFHDDGVYLILAKALASGEGYRYLHLPNAPLATHYPPGYPLLLAALWRLAPDFPRNLELFLAVNSLLLGLVAWGIERLARRQFGWPAPAAVGLALVGALSLPMLLLASLVMSEVFWLALLSPLLLAAERLCRRPRDWKSDVGLGACAGALTLVRTHGIALIIALLLVLAVQRRWRSAAWCAVGAAGLLAPWQIWVALHDALLPDALRGSYGSYLGWFIEGMRTGGATFVARTVASNAAQCAAIIADRLAPWPPGWPRVLPLSLAIALLAMGLASAWRKAPVTGAFLAVYLTVTLVWPYAPWRFVWAVWPLLLLTIGEGCATLWRYALAKAERARLSRPLVIRAIAAAPILLLAAGVLRAEAEAYATRGWSTPTREATRQIAPAMRWVADNTRTDDVVVADAEALVYLFTGRRAVPPAAFTAMEYVAPRSRSEDERTLASLVSSLPVQYVVTIVPTTRDAARELAKRAPATLREVTTLAGGAVFEVARR